MTIFIYTKNDIRLEKNDKFLILLKIKETLENIYIDTLADILIIVFFY